jgi:hypothetical protein
MLEDVGLVRLQKPRPAVPSLEQAEAARNTMDVDVDEQLFGESAGSDRLPGVPLPDDPLPDIPPPEARLECSVREE